ncbi:MAG: sugar phosphate isomerase/epimerase [Chloroflexota bacterium]|nr:sugar phosphate isomerase/epimerase [Chloroflexota bacterium]
MPNHVIVSTLGWSKAPLEEAFAGIAALGFGQVDLALHEGWAHIDPSDIAEGGATRVREAAQRVRALVSRHDMKGVSAMNVGLRTRDPAEQRRRLAAVCDLAAALGVTVITLGAAPRGTPLEDEAARLRALLPEGAARGVQLTVETHTKQVTELPADAVRLCQEVPGLGLTLDASHYYAGPNGGADFAAVLPYVRHVHLRDAGSDWDHIQVAAGTGLVDFDRLVGRLHDLGYGGKFAIEYIDSFPVAAVAGVAAAAAVGSPGAGPPSDIPSNITRMRDVFLAAERGAGISRV